MKRMNIMNAYFWKLLLLGIAMTKNFILLILTAKNRKKLEKSYYKHSVALLTDGCQIAQLFL